MIQYLQGLKNKKGFTLIELIVVIAIIAVLTSIILVNLVGDQSSKQRSYNSAAQTFLTALQLTITRAQTTERELVTYASGETHFIEYEKGVNTIKSHLGVDSPLMFIEAKFEESGIEGVHIEETIPLLMSKADISDDNQTTLEKYLATNIGKYVADSYDGYFYAVVDSSFKVTATYFMTERLPMYTSYASASDYRNALMINSSERLEANGCVLGCCFDGNTIPVTGEYMFNAPGPTEADYSLYFGA